MNETCIKYKASRKSLKETEPSFLRSLFDKLVPGGNFRFITFEQDDYRQACLTFLFSVTIPTQVMIMVSCRLDIKPAIREVIRLNSAIAWNKVCISYPAAENGADGPVSISLLIRGPSLEIDNSGRLIVHPNAD